MPLTASEHGVVLQPTCLGDHNNAVQILTERVSGKMAIALANSVGHAFSYLRNEIHNRKMYVMFEQLLACDPKTDHEAPKDIYPIYSSSVDTAELMIMEHGMEAMRTQLRTGIEEYFIEYIRTREYLELQHDKMSRQIYSLRRRVSELTEILQTILAEKATSTKRNQLKIHELNNIINGYNRSNIIAQSYDFDYSLGKDMPFLINDKEIEQLQREIENKNITISALRSKIQLLSNQLGETKTRTRNILTRSFSRQQSDVHTTRSYSTPVASEPECTSRRTSAGPVLSGSVVHDSKQDFVEGTSTIRCMTTPRGGHESCGVFYENQPEPSQQCQNDNNNNNQDDPRRQSCVPPPINFSSSILRKWQKERQSIGHSHSSATISTHNGNVNLTNDSQQINSHQSPEQPLVPPLQLDTFSCSPEHRNTGEFVLLQSSPSSSHNILNRASFLSPLIPHTMRELSIRTYPLATTNGLCEKHAPTSLDDLCDRSLSSCGSGSNVSFTIVYENVEEPSHILMSKCDTKEDCTASVHIDSQWSACRLDKSVQATSDGLFTSEHNWRNADTALKLLAKELVGSNLGATRYKSEAVQHSAEQSECISYSFYLEPAQHNMFLYIAELRKALRENAIERHNSLRIKPILNDNRQRNLSYDNFDDNLDDIHIEKAQYSSMLHEPSINYPSKASSCKNPHFSSSSRKASLSAPISAISHQDPLTRSSSSTKKCRSILSAWTNPKLLLTAPNERISPRRSNNFLSARSPIHAIEQIQRSNTSASKLINKRTLPHFNINSIIDEPNSSKNTKMV